MYSSIIGRKGITQGWLVEISGHRQALGSCQRNR